MGSAYEGSIAVEVGGSLHEGIDTGLLRSSPRHIVMRIMHATKLALCAAVLMSALPDIVSAAAAAQPLKWRMIGHDIEPGTRVRLDLTTSESFAGRAISTPVIVVRGRRAGPTLCVTAGIHGDELNGIVIAQKVMERAQPETLAGALIAVPIANLSAFRRGVRYLPDRRDLNRSFPGDPRGSLAARVADVLFEEVVRHCTYLVDLHGGSANRTNMPQVRGDAGDARVLGMLRAFGLVAIHKSAGKGTLRRAAGEIGIPAVVFEAGEPLRFDEDFIEAGMNGLERLQRALGMLDPAPPDTPPAREPIVYAASTWVRTEAGGILLRRVPLGAMVAAGDLLGEVLDPLDGTHSALRAKRAGRVIGLALNQLVMPGYGAFHLAIKPLAAGATP